MKHAIPALESDATRSVAVVDSVALARLIDEVRSEHDDVSVARSYDRTHNRHNR